jgi:UDP-2-acetamido-2,6-beta-L-arabino-hexul-4-ose reductase
MSGIFRVGITGQTGFIGSHLFNYFRIQPDIEAVDFNREYFGSESQLEKFVTECDVIIQLAAMSRNPDGKLLYSNNLELDRKLLAALEKQNASKHIIFASTTHQDREGDYYASKRDGQKLFKKWAEHSGGKCTVMVMPNTFGPYGKPFFNSVVSTFCYQVAHGEQPQIIVDAPVELIHIHKLCREFHKVITGQINTESYIPPATATRKVSEIRDSLLYFRESYIEEKVIPKFKDNFELFLFNTFLSYIN